MHQSKCPSSPLISLTIKCTLLCNMGGMLHHDIKDVWIVCKQVVMAHPSTRRAELRHVLIFLLIRWYSTFKVYSIIIWYQLSLNREGMSKERRHLVAFFRPTPYVGRWHDSRHHLQYFASRIFGRVHVDNFWRASGGWGHRYETETL